MHGIVYSALETSNSTYSAWYCLLRSGYFNFDLYCLVLFTPLWRHQIRLIVLGIVYSALETSTLTYIA